MKYPQSETYTTSSGTLPSRTLVVPTGNLERALGEYYKLDFRKVTQEDIKKFLLSHQKDWDTIFLDAYADIDSRHDPIADQVIGVFTSLLAQKLPIEQGQMDNTTDIQPGLRKIANLFITEAAEGGFSFEKLQRFYAVGDTLQPRQKRWNSTIDYLDTTLSAYGKVLLQKLLYKTSVRVNDSMSNNSGTPTQGSLFIPAGETVH